MARGRFYIPQEVKDDIREHLKRALFKTVDEFDSAAEDEDVMTGHLGANLSTGSRPVYVPQGDPPGTWTWSLRYNKFRGRGPGATEKLVGADGIFELSVDAGYGSASKSMLFQSKMLDARDDRGLVEQCAKLTTWREAAAVFSYSPAGFQAFTLDSALSTDGDLVGARGVPLEDFLGGAFLDCVVGDTDLRYHAKPKLLTWTDTKQGRIAVRFETKHRLKIEVRHPSPLDFSLQGRNIISTNDLHKHRMDFSSHDLLTDPTTSVEENEKTARRRLAKVYHPDRWEGYPLEVRETMLSRSKEFNEALDTAPKKG